jgi:hypothetical protein
VAPLFSPTMSLMPPLNIGADEQRPQLVDLIDLF